MLNEKEFNQMMETAESQDMWDDTEPEQWEEMCDFAGINYGDYDDPDEMWKDLCKAWSVMQVVETGDGERIIDTRTERMEYDCDEELGESYETYDGAERVIYNDGAGTYSVMVEYRR